MRSYEGLSECALGRPGWYAYNVCALVNNYGACVGYIVVVGDILPGLLAEMGYPLDRSLVLAIATATIIFPLASLRDFSALQYASGGAIAIYLAFALALCLLYIDGPPAPLEPPPALVKPDAAAFFRAAPICAFAFQAVTSLFPIYQVPSTPFHALPPHTPP